MKTSFSPGHWTIRDDTIRDERYETIAHISKQSNDFPSKEAPEANANALLIAAAPALLEALQAIVIQDDWEGEDIDPASPIGKAYAAINLATGQKIMKYNFMFDVAFTVEGPWELPEDVPAIQLIAGLQKRIADLTLSYANKSEDITEAFEYYDSYKVTKQLT